MKLNQTQIKALANRICIETNDKIRKYNDELESEILKSAYYKDYINVINQFNKLIRDRNALVLDFMQVLPTSPIKIESGWRGLSNWSVELEEEVSIEGAEKYFVNNYDRSKLPFKQFVNSQDIINEIILATIDFDSVEQITQMIMSKYA